MVKPVAAPFFYDQGAAFAITIEHIWMAHLALLEDTLKLEEAVKRIFEGLTGLGMRIHLQYQVLERNFST